MLGGYAPGARPYRLPPGTGRLVEKGSDLVLQVHYHPSGKVERDQASLALYFAREPVERTVRALPLRTRNIDIPAGDPHYERDLAFELPVDLTLITIAPHMHYLGREMRVRATTPGGRIVPLIWIQDWDFRWQGQYVFAEPLRLAKGTRAPVEDSRRASEVSAPIVARRRSQSQTRPIQADG